MRAVELKAPKCTEHHGMASDLIEFRIRLGLFLSSSAEESFISRRYKVAPEPEHVNALYVGIVNSRNAAIALQNRKEVLTWSFLS